MNAWFILLVAISISVVAAYYSIVGIAAIFAGAVVPVIIMASVLEIGKLVSAVLLHENWHKMHILMRTYFTVAVLILMLITSMGIFGFLSRAHIEHSGSSVQIIANIENIDLELSQNKELIASLKEEIDKLQSKDSENFSLIQEQIDQEQANIDQIYVRIQPDIDRLETSLQVNIERKKAFTESIQILDSGNIEQIQSLVGVPIDGNLGPITRNAIQEYRLNVERQMPLLDQNISEINTKILELRESVLPLVQESNTLINQLRSRINFSDNTELEAQVKGLNSEIIDLEASSRTLQAEKFDLETQVRLYEVEIGPIKYIAEFVYGNSDPEIIEKAVRWVIFLIIFVFDPLAVLLVLSAVSSINSKRQVSKSKLVSDDIPKEFYDYIFLDGEENIEVKNDTQDIIVEEKDEQKKPEKDTSRNSSSRNIKYFRKKLFGD